MSEQQQSKPNWITQIATLGPIGNLPGAPGTWGSLATVIAALPLMWLLNGHFFTLILLSIVVGFLGIGVCQQASKDLGRKDPGCVVIDEVAGQLIVLAVAPATLWGALLAFALFRLFDILKPPPIRWFEKLPGGLGVMADDIVAGILGAAVLFVLVRILGLV